MTAVGTHRAAVVAVPVAASDCRVETDADGTRWPVVDGIRWRRRGREALRTAAVARLDAGDADGARVVLLADADDWWDAPPPPSERLALVTSATTLREAVDLLGLGRVGDYLLHRWSDPTYLAALALLQAHWPGALPVVDVACGHGALLRELAQRGAPDLVGVEVVFAKAWLARRFVCPSASYVCADATALYDDDLPPRAPGPAVVLCVDALYFLRDKPAAVEAFRRLAGPGGTVVVGHAHTPAEVHSSGEPLPVREYAALLGADVVYDDDELTSAFLDGRAPRPGAGPEARAVALVAGGPLGPGPDLDEPAGPVRLNPLYADGERRWPGDRWAAEYARAAEYLPERLRTEPDGGVDLPADAARRRVVLDLPEGW